MLWQPIEVQSLEQHSFTKVSEERYIFTDFNNKVQRERPVIYISTSAFVGKHVLFHTLRYTLYTLWLYNGQHAAGMTCLQIINRNRI